MILALIIFAGAIILDQVTKLLFYGKELALLPGFVGILSANGLNTGMAWGMLAGKTGSVIILACFTVITLALLTWLMIRYRREMPRVMQISIAMIAGGAAGNLIDRIALGGVRDFINFEFMEFPIFNVADIFVTCGGILLGVILLFTRTGRRFAELFFADDKKKKGGNAEGENKA